MAEDDDTLDPGTVLLDLKYLQRYIHLGETRSMAIVAMRIKAQVMPVDGMGATHPLLSELVLRTKRLLILTELQTLRQHAARAHWGHIRALPSWEPFSGVEDLTIYTRHELHRITHGWATHRNSTGVERAVYRGALRDAHAEMRTLGHTSDLAAFLGTVATTPRPSPFKTTCERMLTTLILFFDIDPDMPIIAPPTRRPDTTGGVHGRGR